MDVTQRRIRRVGHKGADLIVPGNTRESFDAALAAGVDMIEFDVLPSTREAGGELWLAHDPHDLRRRTPLTLEEGLAHLAAEPFAGIELDVDLKLPGYELRVLSALREYGLLERALISSTFRRSLAVLRAAAPEVRLGWSIPGVRRDPFVSPWLRPLGVLAVEAGRRVFPARAAAAIRSGSVDALMAHWRLITPGLVRAVNSAGGELYAWTVDDPKLIARLAALGVTGIISNDPRLLAHA
jgi:glycerophosphoryl diester phosphodiesterase